MRRPSLIATALAGAALVVALPTAFAGSAADPGVSSTTILIGGTSPLTGQAASYASVARGAKAYFDSVNAKGGVAKRKIDYLIVDDAYNPAQTFLAVRRLVEQERVFAVFNTLGTESNLAVRDYLNAADVPQLFAASGATTFGRDVAKYPWTIGFQPSYAAEGRVYGRYLARTQKNARIAVLFQNDDYGKDLLANLKVGLGRSGSKVIAAEPYEATAPEVGAQIAKLKASRANVLCIFATPPFAIRAFVTANRLKWRPLVINNAVAGTSNTMILASEGGKNKAVEGTISTTSLKDPLDPRWKSDAGMKLYRSIMAQYGAGGSADDANHIYGMSVAFETVALLRRLGSNPTRSGLMKAARSMTSSKNPFLLPGVVVKTGTGDGFPLQQGQLQRWTKGKWVAVGPLWASKKN